MKKYILTTMMLLLMGGTAVNAQTMNEKQAAKMDSMAVALFKNGNFKKSIELMNKWLDDRLQAKGEQDSLYILRTALLAKAYFRDQQIDQAIGSIDKAINLYGKYKSDKDTLYAFYLDNKALYLNAKKDYKAALPLVRKALDIYEPLHKRDFDMAMILIHMAEACHYNDLHQEAIRYELRGLDLYKELFGEETETYLEELSYLKHYYEGAGETQKVRQVETQMNQLAAKIKEKDNGVKYAQFASAEECREHNADALAAAKTYLSGRIDEQKSVKAAAYVMGWTQASPDINLVIADENMYYLGNQWQMLAYFCGCTVYALEQQQKDFSPEMHIAAMKRTLEHYKANRQLTGIVAEMEALSNLDKNGKLEETLRKDAEKILQNMEKAQKKE
ncbi:MAG: tetratricopeptide repeat protein [Prevotella sp.]|nr:tetratricopeptide repeat protein [Prevotella sp.]